ncbi:hypothetical protein NM688_g8194 [Phlebia brevispora]|uniref:Uncharacterized protein n=1 Tax=Phlebia brevispora TaxID=194682 RepID=A0ACC1RW93_9APHY|nr:hypothetical protein NM688_g8194 [Phlebia brevispora]
MLWIQRSLSSQSVWLRSPSARTRPFSFTSNCYAPRVYREIPTFREQIARRGGVKTFADVVKYPAIRNQIFFFAFGGCVTYFIAAKVANADTEYWSQRLSESGSLVWKLRPPSSDEMRRARYYELGKKLQTGLATLKDATQQLPHTLGRVAVWLYVQIAQPILDTTEGKRVCWAIGAVNTAVWIAWQFPRFQPFMMRHFTHSPLSGLSYTMLTCIFSHKSFVHLIFNSMALASFGSAATQYMKKEQDKSPHGLREASVKWHFLAFYISAGLFSSMTSHILMSRIRFPQAVSELISKRHATSLSSEAASHAAKKATSEAVLPSLGASGAIYGTVTLTALAFPDTQIALIFPPTWPIPIQWGVGGLVAMDIIGALRSWRLFDHYAHLGGAAFGALYYLYGPKIWDTCRALDMPVTKASQNSRK